jgi:predicted amidohydrolase YtcJ
LPGDPGGPALLRAKRGGPRDQLGPRADPERIAVQQALSTVTANAARGAFEEHVKGTIELGKLADLVMLAATVVGGEVVYQEAAIG